MISDSICVRLHSRNRHGMSRVEATIHRVDRIVSHRISTETLDGIPIELVILWYFLTNP